jgi:multidrug transporter EmrE-like cation transporter
MSFFQMVATTAMKESEGFTKLGPSLVILAGCVISFVLMSLTLTLKTIPVGVA